MPDRPVLDFVNHPGFAEAPALEKTQPPRWHRDFVLRFASVRSDSCRSTGEVLIVAGDGRINRAADWLRIADTAGLGQFERTDPRSEAVPELLRTALGHHAVARDLPTGAVQLRIERR